MKEIDEENMAYIIDTQRTPVGRRNGKLSGVHPVSLLSVVLKSLVSRNSLDPSTVEDVIAGCVTQTGEQSANIARNAWLSSGYPESVPGVTVDRQCGSSLQASQFAASGIMSGFNDLIIACGVESMSRLPMGINMSSGSFPADRALSLRYRLDGNWFDQARGADMIAEKWKLSREELDMLGYRSHMLAAKHRDHIRNEIVPVTPDITPGIETKVENDEGVRENVSLEKMASLRPAFEGLKYITAGNASQISDGASGILMASGKIAEELNLKPRARFVSMAAVGVDPVTMLTGPIPATKLVLKKAGMSLEDIDIFEVNEAFASVVLAWQKELGADPDKVNISGGAIAIGHPLGATGTRIVGAMINNLDSVNGKYGLIAICEGGGMANAAIVERL